VPGRRCRCSPRRSQIRAARHRGLERVEIHHHQIDAGDPVIAHRLLVAGVVRRARMPMGSRVQGLHAAVMSSGKPVWSLTSTTVSPASRSGLAEPPVDRISIPCAASACPARPGLPCRRRDQAPVHARRDRAWVRDVAGGGGHGASIAAIPAYVVRYSFLDYARYSLELGESLGVSIKSRRGRA